MILMSGYVLGEVPFKKVYFHGTVRDDKGRKMSKSLGNGIDPMDVAKEFGIDAGRMALIIGTSAGTDQKISKDKIKGYKHFANKLWNISRFVMMNMDGYNPSVDLSTKDSSFVDEAIGVRNWVAQHIEDFDFHLAAEKAYHYVWHTFADKVIEDSKAGLAASGHDRESTQEMLFTILQICLKMLHPFMPFVTEEIWSKLPIANKKLLMVERW
jgi:valyl-tRNA synthetase